MRGTYGRSGMAHTPSTAWSIWSWPPPKRCVVDVCIAFFDAVYVEPRPCAIISARVPGHSIRQAPHTRPLFFSFFFWFQLAPRADRDTFFIQNMWAVSNKDAEFNVIHTHPNALLSGVFCESSPPECHQARSTDTCVYYMKTTDAGAVFTSLTQMRGHTHSNGPSSSAPRTHIPPISHLHPTTWALSARGAPGAHNMCARLARASHTILHSS